MSPLFIIIISVSFTLPSYFKYETNENVGRISLLSDSYSDSYFTHLYAMHHIQIKTQHRPLI